MEKPVPLPSPLQETTIGTGERQLRGSGSTPSTFELEKQRIYRVGQKSDTSRTMQCNVREVSLFWPTLYKYGDSVRYKFGAGAPALTLFLFLFSIFSDAILWTVRDAGKLSRRTGKMFFYHTGPCSTKQ